MKKIHAVPLLIVAAAHNASAEVFSNPDSATMIQGTGSININVLANDSSNTESGLVYVWSAGGSTAAYGTVILNENGTLNYTPPTENFIGTDTFTYTPKDDFGYGHTTIVTVEVTARSEPEEPVEPEIPEQPVEPEQPVDPVEPIEPARPIFNIETYVTGERNKSVAVMLGNACNSELVSERLINSCDQLSSQANENGNLDDIVSRIAPDEALIQRRLMAETTRNKTSRLYQAIEQLHSTDGPASLSINNHVLPTGGGAGDGFSSPWTLITSIQTEKFERNQTSKEAGYDSNSVGALLGFGYRANNDLNLGLAFDWSSHKVDFVEHGGNLDSEIYSLNGFLSYYKGRLHVDLQAGFTSGNTQAKRVFTFPDTTVATSDYDSNQWNVSTQLEWAWQLSAWEVKPFLRLDYLNTDVDAFAETGNSIWNVSTAKQNHKLLNSSLGLDTSYTLTKSWGVIIPSLKFSAINQANLSNDPVSFQLLDAGTSGNFQLRSDSADSLFYEWNFSTAFVLPNGVSTFISARAVSSYNNSSAIQFTGGINWEF